MSIVLDRVEESKKRIPEEIMKELTRKRLSQVMRRQTWPDHERAEHHPFEVALVMGTITKEAYADLLGQLWFVYDALEEKAIELAKDPIASPVLFKELPRKAGAEADLEFFLGADWAEKIEPLPVTLEYAERIRNASASQYVAHHYTRYLADLSGGLMIAESLKRAWGLELDGMRFYDFPLIADPTEFKNTYRQTLDDLPIDEDDKRVIIEEVLVAYEYNIEMNEVLAVKHLDLKRVQI